jgi:adenylate cyclase
VRRALFSFASNRRTRRLLLALVALGSIAAGVTTYATGLLSTLEGQTVDARFSIRGHERAPRNIVVVNIDPKTFQDLDLQWPFPRAVDGKLIKIIAAEHPKVIAFDVQLSEKSDVGQGLKPSEENQLSQNDEVALLTDVCPAVAPGGDCMSHPGVTVFSDTEPDSHGNVAFLGSGEGTKLLHQVGAKVGNGSFPVAAGGVTRTMAYEIGNLTTLDVVAADLASHKRISPAEFDHNHAWIDYRGPGGTYPSVSFSTVVGYPGQPRRDQLPPNFFTDKIVVVGATASNLQDLHSTPFDSLMPGAEIHANAIDTLLRGIPLTSDAGWINIALIVLFSLATPLAIVRLGTLAAAGVAVATGAMFVVAAQLAFNSGVVISVIYPGLALVLSAVGSLSLQLLTEAFDRIRTRDLFSRFVPENVVDEVLKSSGGLRLGGVQRNGTVMFTDLRGFTSMAESLTPERVIEVLNRYLSEMSDAILDHGGTLVAYMGDGIMAVFGAPLAQDDHADRALATAREMLDVRLPRFNEWLRAEGLSEGFKMGIGLNSGHVLSGHVGSERRVEYTAVGDTTNTASRIEAMTKGTPHQLLFASTTQEALLSPPGDLVFFDEMPIRGRVETVKLWSIAEPATDGSAEPLQASEPAV